MTTSDYTSGSKKAAADAGMRGTSVELWDAAAFYDRLKISRLRGSPQQRVRRTLGKISKVALSGVSWRTLGYAANDSGLSDVLAEHEADLAASWSDGYRKLIEGEEKGDDSKT